MTSMKLSFVILSISCTLNAYILNYYSKYSLNHVKMTAIEPFELPSVIPTARVIRLTHGIEDYNEITSTPVTFSSSTQSNMKRPVLFLPGLDGMGSYAMESLKNLSREYDLYKLEVMPDDRSSFSQIAQVAIEALKSFESPALLIGESFGGLLATYLASNPTLKPLITNLVLVNPATSYSRTLWQQISPFIVNSGPAFPLVGMGTVLATVVERDQFVRIGQGIIDKLQASDDRVKDLNALYGLSQEFLRLLSPATIEWRLSRWLQNGGLIMKSRYKTITTPTIVLIGTQDRLLPSASEGYRLEKLLENAAVEVKEYRSGGHALLDGTRDLSEILRTSQTLGPPKVSRSLDVPFPSKEDIQDADERLLKNFRQAFSPVFLNRDGSGNLRRGIEHVPVGLAGRPVLFVGNHQLYGADVAFVVREFLVQKQTLVRGLADPILFGPSNPGGVATNSNENSTDNSLFSQNNIAKFGAVEVSPGSIFQLMRRNETILLFPGGANEAFHGKDAAYKLMWPNTTDFVRMAAAFDAIIVPFGAIGIADSVNMLLDGEDINKNALLGSSARRFASRLPRARASVVENFTFPLSVPSSPRRIYFLFQQAFDTREIEVSDKKACREAYLHIKGQVQSSLDTLLEFREKDPYDQFLPRFAYESLSGKTAPTAPLHTQLRER